MLTNYIGQKCPFCQIEVEEKAKIIVCDKCNKPHHDKCWEYNLKRCATLGCKGKGFDPENNIKKEDINIPEKVIDQRELVTSITKIENITQPSKAIIKKGKPQPIKTNIQNKHTDKTNKSNLFVPDYVFKDLKEFKQEQTRNSKEYKIALAKSKFSLKKLPEIKNNNNQKSFYKPYPKPEPFIPEYVFRSIKDYLLEKLKENPRNIIPKGKPYKPIQIIPRLKDKENDYKPYPKPEPYIPNYVNQDLKKFLAKKLKEKPRRRLSKTKKYIPPELPIIHFRKKKVDFIEIEKPEPFIPDYVFENQIVKKLLILPEKLKKSKFCPHCNSKISLELKKCSNCDKYIDKIEKTTVKIRKLNSNNENNNKPYKILNVNARDIKRIEFSKDNKYIAFSSQNKDLNLWEIENGDHSKKFEGHTNWISSITFSHDGELLFTGSIDTTIKIWEIKSEYCLKTLEGNKVVVDMISCSPNNKYIASGGGYGIAKIWDRKLGKCLYTLSDNSSWVNSSCFNSDSSLLATGDADNIVRIWYVNLGKCITKLSAHMDSVNDVKFSPNGLQLASCGSDGYIILWDTHKANKLKELKGHRDSVNSISFTPNGKYLISGSDDGTIRVWNVSTGVCVRNIEAYNNSIIALTTSNDGRFIATSSNDRKIKIWKLF